MSRYKGRPAPGMPVIIGPHIHGYVNPDGSAEGNYMTMPAKDQLTIAEYCEQRKWDSFDDDEEQAAGTREYALRREGSFIAYQDVLNFVKGNYRQEYLDAVEDRMRRRLLVGPRRRTTSGE